MYVCDVFQDVRDRITWGYLRFFSLKTRHRLSQNQSFNINIHNFRIILQKKNSKNSPPVQSYGKIKNSDNLAVWRLSAGYLQITWGYLEVIGRLSEEVIGPIT